VTQPATAGDEQAGQAAGEAETIGQLAERDHAGVVGHAVAGGLDLELGLTAAATVRRVHLLGALLGRVAG
jgi:hypothetical protein